MENKFLLLRLRKYLIIQILQYNSFTFPTNLLNCNLFKIFIKTKFCLYRCHIGHINDVLYLVKVNDTFFASAGGTWGQTIRLWDINKDESVRILTEHSNGVRCLLKLTENRFASGSDDRTIRIWGLENDKSVRTLDASN